MGLIATTKKYLSLAKQTENKLNKDRLHLYKGYQGFTKLTKDLPGQVALGSAAVGAIAPLVMGDTIEDKAYGGLLGAAVGGSAGYLAAYTGGKAARKYLAPEVKKALHDLRDGRKQLQVLTNNPMVNRLNENKTVQRLEKLGL